MKFRTVVDTSFPEIRIAPEDEMTLLGSCFADHIGRRMCRAGFDVNVNPFGVLYNPQSIATVCTFAASGKSIPEDCFFEADGLWHNWLNDSSFSAESREACRARWETVCREERERLCTLRFLFITLGTNRCYVLKENGRVVGNCHKQPACRFTERQMGVEDTAEVLGEMLHELWTVNPALQVVFTVSPYRYAKYGFHDSQLGKAVLLLAVDAVCRNNEGRCHYFPAYEIVLDELRDYRFYAEDLLHPSETAVEYIWERFSDLCFSPDARSFKV